MITPYTIAIPQADLDEVQARLARIRWANELPGVGADYGEPLAPIKRIVTYWREKYDWRVWEAKLNAYPQFTVTIDGQNIHFLHIRSKVDNALPLILTHGWPTSVVDYLDLIGPLTDPRFYGDETGQAFHLVIPSLPGFGFSGPTHEAGWNQYRTARAWAELMYRLGYDRYGVHGNDWGSVLSPEIGRFDPEHVVGVHVTQIFSEPSGDPAEMEALSAAEKDLWQNFHWWRQHRGLHLPHTVTSVHLGSGGQPLVTDGPFLEGTEVIGGIAEIEVADLDEALLLAKEWSVHGPGHNVVEIWPVVEEPDLHV